MKISLMTLPIVLMATLSLTQSSRMLPAIEGSGLVEKISNTSTSGSQNSNIRPAPKTSSDKFFDELMKPYKGKVVYIDFWAPWCGPCMREMPASQKLQQELKGKDVVFLFIGLSCTKASWESTIKEKGFTGEQYYASENEAKMLADKFNITGIPRYVLVDKQGKVADGNALRPSDKNKLVKKIDGLLKK